jgi:raffinose/stachyose/melibiose transport system permease protein
MVAARLHPVVAFRAPARLGPIRPGPVLERIGIVAALGLLTAQAIYPLLWVLIGSLKDKSDFIASTWGLPGHLHFDNYARAWAIAGMGSRLFNSVVVTAAALVVVLATATPCAYALARLRFRGRATVTAVAVAAMLVPPQVMAIPLFLLAADLGLINSRLGVALVYAATGLPLSVFLLRGFFLSLPADLEDAARVDGAGRLTILVRVMLPLIRPGIALVLIFQFIEIWNDFFIAFLLLREPSVQTIPLGLVNFFQQYDALWPLYFAALIMTTVPVIAVFVVMQRQFIAGLTAGAVKG